MANEGNKKPIFKKWWFWVIVVLVIGAIGASLDDEESAEGNKTEPASSQVDGSNDNAESNSEPENTQENEPEIEDEEKTEFGINEKIEFEGRILEVTNVEKSSGDDFDKPKDGHEYVIVSVNIENSSDKEVSYNPFDFKMQNSNGQIETQTFTIVDSDTALSSGNLASGGNVSGTIAFEQPIDDDALQLIFEPSFWSSKKVTISLN